MFPSGHRTQAQPAVRGVLGSSRGWAWGSWLPSPALLGCIAGPAGPGHSEFTWLCPGSCQGCQGRQDLQSPGWIWVFAMHTLGQLCSSTGSSPSLPDVENPVPALRQPHGAPCCSQGPGAALMNLPPSSELVLEQWQCFCSRKSIITVWFINLQLPVQEWLQRSCLKSPPPLAECFHPFSLI